MKRLCVVILLTFHFCKAISGQESQNKNLVFFEAAGVSFDGAGFGYERYFYLGKLLRASARGGIAFAGEDPATAPFLGGSILFGKKSNVEFGFNALFNYKDVEFETLYEYPNGDENGPPSISYSENVVHKNVMHLLLGYRFQSIKSGIMFRVFITSPHQLSIWGFPGAGVSVGVAF